MPTLVTIADALSKQLDTLSFAPPVSYVYNASNYARAPAVAYMQRYGQSPKKTLLLGMNPGPFGMAQTGVPFGEVTWVRDWLQIEEHVGKPPQEHPARPITGFACKRSEVSGSRLWGWAKANFVTPDAFFTDFYVYNYCPLVFMSETGRNLTPDKLGRAERDALFGLCDAALAQVVTLLGGPQVIGVGAFAAKRAAMALPHNAVAIGQILHPSPASPLANRGWAEQATAQLAALGVVLPSSGHV
jgi:single-strand selective monofunctional uracil DNA glycosylase